MPVSISEKPGARIIVALDVSYLSEARHMISRLSPYVDMFKVGLQAITAGLVAEIIKCAHSYGCRIFYDGKFHDIQATVQAASCAAAELGAAMLSVHALSGPKVMQAAMRGVDLADDPPDDRERALVLAVTVLTCHDYADLVKIGLLTGLESREGPHDEDLRPDLVRHCAVRLAGLAAKCGVNGIIASPQEVAAIRKACPDKLIVVPGIRPAWAPQDDQERAMTPYEAVMAGADYLIIGRPITDPPEGTPEDAVLRIIEEIAAVQV